MRRLTPSLVLSVVAIFLALAGGATAAKLISGKDIKNSSVTGADIRDGSLGSNDLSEGSIGPSRLSLAVQDKLDRAGTPGPQGPTGPAGSAGPQGPAGPAGVTGVKAVSSAPKAFSAGGVVFQTVDCPGGSAVVGGGYRFATGGQTSIAHSVGWDAPVGNGWGVIIISNDEEGDELIVDAVCANGQSATARSAVRPTTEREFEARASALAARR